MTTVSDPSGSSSSVLTNVAPPSALPSFLTSPLPSAAHPSPAPSIPPKSYSQTTSIAASLPSASVSHAHSPSNATFTSPATFPPNSSIPATTSSSVPCSEMAFPSYSANPGTVILPHGSHPSSGTFVPSEVSAFPPPPLSLQSHSSQLGEESHSVQVPQSPNTSSPVTSQPQPPNSGGSTDASACVDLSSPNVAAAFTKKEEGNGWLGWIRGTVSNVGHRVAERAKTSMDSMITTLDPQMKEFIYSGGDLDIVVASDKEIKVGAIREAFQRSFGKATVCGMKAEAQGVAAQPVGFEAALTSAEGRINYLRSTGQIHPQQPIVAVENFIVEFHSDCWFDLGLLLLDDPGEDILLQTYTQVSPVPPDFVKQARTATPHDYPFKDSGFAVTIGQIASQSLQVHHSMWQEALTGVSRREGLVLAGRTLAGLYRSRLPTYQ